MSIVSLKQLSNEIGYLQTMLIAVQAKATPFLTPLQAARLVHQLNGLRMLVAPSQTAEAELYRDEIERLLEHAYDVIGTAELTA